MSDNSRLMQTLLVIISACVTAEAFSGYVAFSFIGLFPLFYMVLTYKNNMGKLGFLWGATFFTLHGLTVLKFIARQGIGPMCLGGIIFLTIFYALHTALWVWLMHKLTAYHCCTLIICSLIFFWWQQNYMMWIIGVPTGYPLSFPLLPLAAQPQLLWLLPYVGEYILLMLVLVGNTLTAYVFCKRSMRVAGAAGILLGIFLVGFVLPEKPFSVYAQELVDNVAYCKPPRLSSHPHPLDAAQEITYALQECVRRNPECSCVLMPESTYPFVLKQYSFAQELWTENALGEDRTLVLGAHRRNRQQLFNTAYALQECRITFTYDKQWCVPFYEYIPRYCKSFPLLCRLFTSLYNNDEEQSFFSCGKPGKELMPLTGNVRACLLMCSELFCQPYRCYAVAKNDAYECVYLCLVNDGWCSNTYYEYLMRLYARYCALGNQVPYVYVGHNGAFLYTPCGKTVTIPC